LILSPAPYAEAGKQLRAERERLRLSTREVEKLSEAIAAQKHSQDFYLSHAWLTDVENGKFKPNLFKAFTLCVIYKLDLDRIADFYGIPYRDLGKEQQTVTLPRTHLMGRPIERADATLTAPLTLQDRIRLQETNLVSQMFSTWGEVPITLLQQLDLRHSVYGYIGIEDYTLYPLIRPGSFVQIDPQQRKVQSGKWQNDFDRPIYFVELRDSYVCSWCELYGSHLILIPSAQSNGQARHLRYPGDAEIVGRVTAVTTRITDDRSSVPR